MSFRSHSMMTFGLLALTALACDDLGRTPGSPTGSEEPSPAVAAQPLSIERACLDPLSSSDSELNARLVLDLAEGSAAPAVLEARPTKASGYEEDPILFTDDGLGADLRAGDGRFSAAVAVAKSARDAERCGDADDLGLTIESRFAAAVETISSGDGGGDMHNCPFRPIDWSECIECGGEWRPFYRCGYWYCWQDGYRCYGW